MITDMNEPLFPSTNALQTPNPPFWTTKTTVPKFPQNGGSTPTLCLDKAVHAQGGGGYILTRQGPIGGADLRNLEIAPGAPVIGAPIKKKTLQDLGPSQRTAAAKGTKF